ncbi:6,7-dimethyl-8-ribityllumazine synthase [Stratiformator vulcanicus]|uniref:6,7-dimethyl-8-ribityllumazine synthase n=1 Tax=Stratiformator vulcanicus TaxID=2527980 RepID=A0A517R659_9PLAN|nr:6,7-dimethyl-8-ribityllumazine synthase [Stratiformator vulcanicus]QDT39384.1 6,7-dimethyl-8-ribityllumazine synthase [Stratiformator vulcanicus]
MSDNSTKKGIKPTKISLSEGARFAVVAARWNAEITDALHDAAVETLQGQGVPDNFIETYRVPGAFELPAAAAALSRQDRYANGAGAVICLGAVIKGDTEHDRFINQSVAEALQRIAAEHLTPVMFGVLTCNTMEQARERAGGVHGNKGAEAALAAIEMVSVLRSICSPSQPDQ